MIYDIGFKDKEMSGGTFVRIYFADLPGGGKIEGIGDVGFWQVVAAILLSFMRLGLEKDMTANREEEWREFFLFNFHFLRGMPRYSEFRLKFNSTAFDSRVKQTFDGAPEPIPADEYDQAAVTPMFS